MTFLRAWQCYVAANPANRGSLAIFSSGDTLSSKNMSLMLAFFLFFFSSFLSAGGASFATEPIRSSTDACIGVGSEPFWAMAGGAPNPGRAGTPDGCAATAPEGGAMAPFVEKGWGGRACGGYAGAPEKGAGGAPYGAAAGGV